MARGTAPLILVVVGLVVLGERLAPGAALGVAILLAGLLTVQRPWRFLRGETANRAAVAFALLTGVTIARYTSLDRVGVQLAPPWLYGAILWLVAAVGLLVVAVARSRVAGGRYAVTGPAGRAAVRGERAAHPGHVPARAVRPVAGTGRRGGPAARVRGAAHVRLRACSSCTRRSRAARSGLRLAGSVLVVLGAVVLAVAG